MFERRVDLPQCLVPTTEYVKKRRLGGEQVHIAGGDRHCLLEFPFGSGPVPITKAMNQAKCRVRVRAFRIKPECDGRQAAGLLKTGGRFHGTRHHSVHIRISEPGCRLGERRVSIKCLLKQCGRRIRSFGVIAVIDMTTAQI